MPRHVADHVGRHHVVDHHVAATQPRLPEGEVEEQRLVPSPRAGREAAHAVAVAAEPGEEVAVEADAGEGVGVLQGAVGEGEGLEGHGASGAAGAWPARARDARRAARGGRPAATRGRTGPARRARAIRALADALAAAAARNEVAGIAAARLDRARAARREALATLFPSLTANGTYTRRAFEVTRQLGGQEVVLQRHDALAGDLTLQASLLDARAWAGLEGVRHATRAEELDARALGRALAFDVARSFFAVLSAERLAAAAGERLQAATAAAAHARSRVDAGLAPRNEATRTALEEATARLAVEDAGLAVARARLALGHLVVEDLGDRPLVEPAEAPRPALDPAALEAAALDAREDVAALDARTGRARAAAREPWLRLVPTLGLRGVVRVFNEAGFVGRNVDGQVALTLSWAVFDGGARYARADVEAANLREAELAAAAARRRVGLEVRGALADLAGADAALARATLRAEVARAHADEVRTLAARGLASVLEQVDAAVSAFEAGAELARLEVRRRVAELGLLEALGEQPVAQGAAP